MPNTREPPLFPWWHDQCVFDSHPIPKDKTLVGFESDSPIFETPKSIKAHFDKQLYGCEEYKRAIATAIWSSLNRNIKSNFLIVGESGCGKTELARIVSQVYSNTVIFDASQCSPKSYKGNATLSDTLLNIDTRPSAPPAWVFIDEFDKALAKAELGAMLEAELLKFTEGAEIFVGEDKSRKLVDTSKVNFVFMGTFAALKKNRSQGIGFNADYSPKEAPITKETIVTSGLLSNEFLGRINGGIIQVEPMTNEKAMQLLMDERYSPVERLSKQYRVNLNLTPDKYLELANMTSKYGVRGIYAELQSKINDALFEDASITTITI